MINIKYEIYHTNMCRHNLCKSIKMQRKKDKKASYGGIGMIILNDCNNDGRYCVLLGKEKYGLNANKFNLCAGGVDDDDNGCYVKAAKRELMEEFKLTNFDEIFDINDLSKVIWIGDISKGYNTPVLIGLAKDISRDSLNKKISQDNDNTYLPHQYKEMSSVDLFWLDSKEQIEGLKNNNISSFAHNAMDEVHQKIEKGEIKF